MSFNNKKNKKQNNQKSDSLLKRFTEWLRSLTFFRHLFIWYFIIIVVGSLLLTISAAHNAGQKTSYLDNLFTAASAFTNTGLVTKITAKTWSIFGQSILAILILLGGLGWFAIKVYIFSILFRRPLSLISSETSFAERGSTKLGRIKKLIKVSITVMLVMLVVFSLILTIYFYLVPGSMQGYDLKNVSVDHKATLDKNYYGVSAVGNWSLAARYGIFHTISALNNSGFDIIGQQSIAGYYKDYGIQVIIMFLFILGGIGYPVIYDIYASIKAKIFKRKHRWSLFSKISMVSYTVIMILGLIIAFSVETTSKNNKIQLPNQKPVVIPSFWNDPAYGSHSDKAMALVFNTMSTRNAGFSTIRISSLSGGTKILYSVLMFVGAAPSSTAGGIRTTTIAILILGLITLIKGRKKVLIFNRRIPTTTVTRSYIVIITGAALVLFISLILMTSLSTYKGEINSSLQTMNPIYIDPQTKVVHYVPYTYSDIFFEVNSAFGTTGLSTGITSLLSKTSKVFLILLMFIGQLGVSSSLLVWGNKKRDIRHYSFIEEDISIG